MAQVRTALQRFSKRSTSLADRLAEPELPERLRGGRIARVVEFWASLFRDYRSAFNDLRESCRNTPGKAALITSTFVGTLYLNSQNPDERSFREAFTSYSNEISLVPSSIVRPESVQQDQKIRSLMCGGQLRRWNLGVASLMWSDESREDLADFAANSRYYDVGYVDFLRQQRDRVIDVGFLGRWWVLAAKERDCDVNPEEWNQDGSPRAPNRQLRQMW